MAGHHIARIKLQSSSYAGFGVTVQQRSQESSTAFIVTGKRAQARTDYLVLNAQ
jgi:hypothetical protein